MASRWGGPPSSLPPQDSSPQNPDSQRGDCTGVLGVSTAGCSACPGRADASPGLAPGWAAGPRAFFLPPGCVSAEGPASLECGQGPALGAPGLFLQRGLSRVEREGVLVSLTLAGRGLVPAPGTGRQKSRRLLLPPPLPSRPGGQVPSPSAPVPPSWRRGGPPLSSSPLPVLSSAGAHQPPSAWLDPCWVLDVAGPGAALVLGSRGPCGRSGSRICRMAVMEGRANRNHWLGCCLTPFWGPCMARCPPPSSLWGACPPMRTRPLPGWKREPA